jgi:hypothetical protein
MFPLVSTRIKQYVGCLWVITSSRSRYHRAGEEDLMNPITVRVFVSSTWLDLQPERAAVEGLLQRFRETKFIGMEYFGSRDETTRQASLAEVERSHIYVGILGGRYGSGITEAEYDQAKDLPRLLYFKQDSAVPDGDRDVDPAQLERLKRFKEKVRDPARGHTVIEFSNPQELASRLAADLHNWMFDQYLASALEKAHSGNLAPDQAAALDGDLRHFVKVNRDYVAQAGEEARVLDQWRRLVSAAFYRLTYDVTHQLTHVRGTLPFRETIARKNIEEMSALLRLTDGAPEVLREIATNYRVLAAILLEKEDRTGAQEAFQVSAAHCASLVKLRPSNALYHRDLGTSRYNLGTLLEAQGDRAAAREEYVAAVESYRRAVELDPQDLRWPEELRDARSAVERTGE